MVQNTGFVAIGLDPGLASTSSQRSNNFEVSQMFFEMEVETNL